MDFTPENVFSLIQSDDLFPVDFDDAWKWIGWPKKQHGKEVLFNNFDESFDFLRNGVKSSSGGRPSEWIVLTVDCFKSLAMMAGTERGREVRQYFLKCEQELKQRLQKEQESKRDRVLQAVVSKDATAWRKRFEDVFFDEAYRITGWKRTVTGHPPCMGKFVNENVYDRFPEGTTRRLQHVNPKVNGRRKNKHHQHLTSDVGSPLLAYQKGMTIAVMRLSPSQNSRQFKANMQKACGDHIQLELLDEAS
jgi:phage anti-repressor protein